MTACRRLTNRSSPKLSLTTTICFLTSPIPLYMYRRIYHADRLCPRLLTAHSLSISDRISTTGATFSRTAVTPSVCPFSPAPFPAMHKNTCPYVGCASYGMVWQRFVPCAAEGVLQRLPSRNPKYKNAQIYVLCYMAWRPWSRFGRKLKGSGPSRASGKVGPHGIFSNRKRYGPR